MLVEKQRKTKFAECLREAKGLGLAGFVWEKQFAARRGFCYFSLDR